jgi:hypothetical protein
MTGHTTTGSPAATRGGAARVDSKAVWDQFRACVRTLLHDQPSDRLVRTTAHRMDQYVLAAADAELTAREQSEEEHR